jgi:serine/threonine protein kinase/Tfp pilus assembly protein PilF
MSEQWTIGQIIKEHYEIFDIKKGGMGIVFICYDNVEKAIFALKTFRDKFLFNNQVVGRFINEATTWIHLERHPNIVRAYSVEEIHFRPYIFLEYIASDPYYGLDLAERLSRRRLPLETVLDFALQFCEGMVYAQAKLTSLGKQFVHADIKPANILIQNPNTLKITDFGLSRAFDDEGSSSGWGTLAYMSPEQFTKTPLDVRSDIYSFGCVLYEMVTGTTPFVIDENKDLALARTLYREKHFQDLPREPKELKKDCPQKLNDLILKCLEKNPAKRIPDFNTLKAELTDLFCQLTGKIVQKILESKQSLNKKDMLNKSISLIALGKYQDAVVCLDMVLGDSFEPDLNYRIYCSRGSAFDKMDQTEKALADYEAAVRLFPDRPFAYNMRANLYNDLGELQKALSDYNKAIVLDNEFAIAFFSRGLCYRRLEQSEKALADFSRAIELGFHESYTNRGSAYQQLGKYEEALSDYNKAIELNPRNAIAFTNIGSIYEEWGQFKKAAEYYATAIKISPFYLLPYFNRAYLLIKEEQYPAAIEDYEKALTIDPSQVSKEASVNYAFTKKELDHIYPLIFHNCGITYLKIGNLLKGKEYLHRFLEIASPYYLDKIEPVTRMLTWVDETLGIC